MAKGIKTGGRQKGTPNKATATIKAAVQNVYDKLQAAAGGDDAHFTKWANENPTEFYKIASKLIPAQLDASVTYTLADVFDDADASA